MMDLDGCNHCQKTSSSSTSTRSSSHNFRSSAMLLQLRIALLAVCWQGCAAFQSMRPSSVSFVSLSPGPTSPQPQQQHAPLAATAATSTTRLWAMPEEEALARERNDARTDIQCLLTQRAIQSFLYLLVTVRDPHSGRWIEDFLGTKNQLQYHGTGAAYMETFGNNWDGPFLAMMEAEKDIVVVSAKRSGKGHMGWSKDNPYLEDRYVDFHIDVDPVSLASRILSVREQIAQEWASDLDILDEANRRILDSYLANRKEQRQMQGAADAPSSCAFERTVALVLNDQTAFGGQSSSPLRKGNFDLLYNLCTRASVHRLLRQLKDGGSVDEVAFAWLRQFYVDRVGAFFDGDQPHGRADDFLEELLLAPPSVITTETGVDGLADPLKLAEDIIQLRHEIVKEWKALMLDVPQAHAGSVRKVLLEKQMASWGSGTPLGGGGGGGSFQ